MSWYAQIDMPHRPSLNALRTFEAAVRRGSFAAAAAELRLTPSAVSRQIQLLEQQLGVMLFHRSRPVGRLDRCRTGLLPRGSRCLRAHHRGDGGHHRQRQERPACGAFRAQLRDPVAAAAAVRSSWRASGAGRGVLGDVAALRPSHRALRRRYPARGARDTDGLDVMPFPAERIVPMCSPALADGIRPIRTPEDLDAASADPFRPVSLSAGRTGWSVIPACRSISTAACTSTGRSCRSPPPSTASASASTAPCWRRMSWPAGRLVKPLGDDGPEIHAHRLACLQRRRTCRRSSPSGRG